MTKKMFVVRFVDAISDLSAIVIVSFSVLYTYDCITSVIFVLENLF